MRTFFEWMELTGRARDRWCVLGQGPSLFTASQFPKLDLEFSTMGLNRACLLRKVFVTHIIDLHVLKDVPDIDGRSSYLVMPWRPHVNEKQSKEPLPELVARIPILRRMDEAGRLLWYNLSTAKYAPPKNCPIVQVRYFSSEAAIRLLAMTGVRTVRTLGVDGGTGYAEGLPTESHLRAGHTSYSKQDEELGKIVAGFGLDFGPLMEKVSQGGK